MMNHMVGKLALVLVGSFRGHVGDIVEVLEGRIFAIRLIDGTTIDIAFGDFIAN